MGRFVVSGYVVTRRAPTPRAGVFNLCATDAYGPGRKHLNHVELWRHMFLGDDLADQILDAASLRHVYDLLHGYPLMGDFMSCQTAIDLNYLDARPAGRRDGPLRATVQWLVRAASACHRLPGPVLRNRQVLPYGANVLRPGGLHRSQPVYHGGPAHSVRCRQVCYAQAEAHPAEAAPVFESLGRASLAYGGRAARPHPGPAHPRESTEARQPTVVRRGHRLPCLVADDWFRCRAAMVPAMTHASVTRTRHPRGRPISV
ncbi:hypothetical protein Are01nite_72450 [Actinoplanes regularis]|nr:hypothetical protein Are01nite_72450 [Actinoplanes regularis]